MSVFVATDKRAAGLLAMANQEWPEHAGRTEATSRPRAPVAMTALTFGTFLQVAASKWTQLITKKFRDLRKSVRPVFAPSHRRPINIQNAPHVNAR